VDVDDKSKLREFLKVCLAERGDRGDFRDDESLFVSGRLDSLAVTKLVVYLESAFGIDFADVIFDVDLVDSVEGIESFLDEASIR
jgi:acyl carrier protein